jgi:hypothetical protein
MKRPNQLARGLAVILAVVVLGGVGLLGMRRYHCCMTLLSSQQRYWGPVEMWNGNFGAPPSTYKLVG